MLYKLHIQAARWFCPSLQVAALKKLRIALGAQKNLLYKISILYSDQQIKSHLLLLQNTSGRRDFIWKFPQYLLAPKKFPKMHLTNSC